VLVDQVDLDDGEAAVDTTCGDSINVVTLKALPVSHPFFSHSRFGTAVEGGSSPCLAPRNRADLLLLGSAQSASVQSATLSCTPRQNPIVGAVEGAAVGDRVGAPVGTTVGGRVGPAVGVAVPHCRTRTRAHIALAVSQ
jgi:hypothetical protein